MRILANILLWSGRALAVGFALFWGAFFVEHLGWFLHPGQGLPPPRVWFLQLTHAALLAGLVALLRWEVPGGLLTIAAALVFFAGAAGARFPVFFGATIVPVVLVFLGRWLFHRQVAPPAA
jgi:hypothetical protein